MLQQLAAETGATGWVVASMLFFIGAWVFIAVRVCRARSEEMEARARMALEGDDTVEADPPRDSGVRA